VIITILSVVTWISSHELDPYRAIDAKHPAITVQVVALDWKWLFIYPQQRVASVNMFEMPLNTPVSFEITSDTVMNSFWVPNLGGQIYAMPGMSTQLHLIANRTGNFPGSSANISGQGFAGMTFTAKAVTQANFNSWMKTLQKSPKHLTQTAYNQLAMPSENSPVSYYSSAQNDLYDMMVMKYMTPNTQLNGMTMGGM
jgi:cytochrome o ubiquinol oxidase subunit 2